MTAGLAGTECYDATRHDVTGFSCGNELLDRWLVCYAGHNQRRDAARTFVAATTDQRVYGYYTLLAGQLDHHEAVPKTSKGYPSIFDPSRDPCASSCRFRPAESEDQC